MTHSRLQKEPVPGVSMGQRDLRRSHTYSRSDTGAYMARHRKPL